MRRNHLERMLDNPPPSPHVFHNKLWERAAMVAREVDAVMGIRQDIPPGLKVLTGNQTIALANITAAISQGYSGIFLDPRYTYTVAQSLVLDGISNFTIESRMVGSLGTGNPTVVFAPAGFVSTSIAQQAISSTTNGTTTVTSAALFGSVTVGMRVTGTGTTAGTYVTAVGSSSSITVNQSITTGTPTLTFSSDGIQVYGPSSGTTTNGIVFRGVAFIGNNPGAAVVHNAGNARSCAQIDCFISNTTANTNANSYGFLNDTALAAGPQEDLYAVNCIWAGPRAYGLDVDSITGHANDSLYVNLQTQSTGDYSIYAPNGGGNHEFLNYYDRSNPSVGTVLNGGAVLYFNGGEDLCATGAAQICSGGRTILQRRSISPGGAGTDVIVTGGTVIFNDGQINSTTGFTVSSGTIAFRGQTTFTSAGATLVISGTGTANFSDPNVSAANCTVTGSAGTLYIPGRIGPGSVPVFGAYTGQILGPLPIHVATSGRATAFTATWTPPASPCTVRINLFLVTTVAGTTTTPTITYQGVDGTLHTGLAFVIWRQNGALAPVAATGAVAASWVGSIVIRTDNSATAIQCVVTPNGSTFDADITYELLSSA